MMGGIFWATGNLMTVPIIKSIGIGLGPLLWNTVLLVFGWAVARFGLLGIKEVYFKGLDISLFLSNDRKKYRKFLQIQL